MTAANTVIDRQLLKIYLSDHVAGAAGALARAERMAHAYRSTPLGGPIAEFAAELAEERTLLLDIADRLDLPVSRWKSAAAVAAERVGRLKPNGRATSTTLVGIVELELLRAGVNGKRGIWDSLAAWSAALELDRATFVELDRHALDQIDTLTRLAGIARDRVAAGASDVRDGSAARRS
jgi:UDP-glucose 4-epimerase